MDEKYSEFAACILYQEEWFSGNKIGSNQLKISANENKPNNHRKQKHDYKSLVEKITSKGSVWVGGRRPGS